MFFNLFVCHLNDRAQDIVAHRCEPNALIKPRDVNVFVLYQKVYVAQGPLMKFICRCGLMEAGNVENSPA